ncbi:MAG: DUF1489 domain-containing protein [Novosphingobium sp.]|nr:DUF1489 domain-containing protein [Novosphingobium sp.]
MTKIAYGAESPAALGAWLESQATEARMTTRYLPRRHGEMAGGSLYWIHEHVIIGRSPLIGFTQREDGRWWIRLEPVLIPVHPMPRRAHQGWRYLAAQDAPPDIAGAPENDAALPVKLAGELARLGLV